ncbi:hypothetical protein T4D_1650 [Trichinella pseudospiralis]|uniref:Uncharacterized protein n=1 Tax=Trichinella pseudospiralis TaxID=6337 RepID=A0A0V1FKD0_TRIPS|nr:hypothetical protein T4D_1650 [Trichinella pseudospiralis]
MKLDKFRNKNYNRRYQRAFRRKIKESQLFLLKKLKEKSLQEKAIDNKETYYQYKKEEKRKEQTLTLNAVTCTGNLHKVVV